MADQHCQYLPGRTRPEPQAPDRSAEIKPVLYELRRAVDLVQVQADIDRPRVKRVRDLASPLQTCDVRDELRVLANGRLERLLSQTDDPPGHVEVEQPTPVAQQVVARAEPLDRHSSSSITIRLSRSASLTASSPVTCSRRVVADTMRPRKIR